LEYQLIRANRRTVSIHITGEATVEVRAPIRMPKEEIDRFVHSKADWIHQHLKRAQEDLASRESFRISFGDRLPLGGKMWEILRTSKNRPFFSEGGFCIPATAREDQIRRGVMTLYKKAAREVIPARVAHYAPRMGVTPTDLRIGSARTTWGSCSAGGRLNFSWFIMMGDMEMIDYLIVHELSHLIHHNHSAAFWAVVAIWIPDYQLQKKRLKALHEKLRGENWK
jgi:predicted metal-dependent hydrolase